MLVLLVGLIKSRDVEYAGRKLEVCEAGLELLACCTARGSADFSVSSDVKLLRGDLDVRRSHGNVVLLVYLHQSCLYKIVNAIFYCSTPILYQMIPYLS